MKAGAFPASRRNASLSALILRKAAALDRYHGPKMAKYGWDNPDNSCLELNHAKWY